MPVYHGEWQRFSNHRIIHEQTISLVLIISFSPAILKPEVAKNVFFLILTNSYTFNYNKKFDNNFGDTIEGDCLKKDWELLVLRTQYTD